MSLQSNSQFQPQATGNFGGNGNAFGGSNQSMQSSGTNQFQGTSNFGSAFTSPPSADIFSTGQPTQNYSTMATQGSNWASQSNSSTGTSKKATSDEFGAFQTSENDAWSMGQGLGKSYSRSNLFIVNLGNIKKKDEMAKPGKQVNLFNKPPQT